MRRIRTFIAVPVSLEIRSAARKLTELLQHAAGDVRWVAPENLHWTMQFLGDVDELEIPAVCSAVSSAAADLESFDHSARGAGAFPAPDRPRTLWLGAGAGAQAMVALHTAIQKKLDRLGYRSEHRRFVPHVTLGRAGKTEHPRSLVRELAGLAEFDGGLMLVDEVTVYSSELRPDGPIYEVLARAPLAN
jgi:2'-5' RNA ligase